ncbi:unnamed protein product [Protopolystoma xenopodis]|uniref:Uncharacterized protein n=1 Tax=Protopolystoma xenopodis TaxID=117903 RepID=A0A448WGT5_9PLAT|nr:unnamed protein product [Protopolystoma xenopodis]
MLNQHQQQLQQSRPLQQLPIEATTARADAPAMMDPEQLTTLAAVAGAVAAAAMARFSNSAPAAGVAGTDAGDTLFQSNLQHLLLQPQQPAAQMPSVSKSIGLQGSERSEPSLPTEQLIDWNDPVQLLGLYEGLASNVHFMQQLPADIRGLLGQYLVQLRQEAAQLSTCAGHLTQSLTGNPPTSRTEVTAAVAVTKSISATSETATSTALGEQPRRLMDTSEHAYSVRGDGGLRQVRPVSDEFDNCRSAFHGKQT